MPSHRYDDLPDLLLKSECAKYLRVSIRSLENLIRSGSLAAIKWNGTVRIEKTEARAFLERHRLDPHKRPEAPAGQGKSPSPRRTGTSDLRLARDVAAELRTRRQRA
jgi:excisionase family DNA binding protein